jgi:hypothetical protein
MGPSQIARKTDSAKVTAKAKAAELCAGEARAALAAQFVPSGAAVLEITAGGGAWLQRRLPQGCAYQSVKFDAALPASAAKADIVVMLDVLERIADPDALLAQLVRTPRPLVISCRPRDLADGDNARRANDRLGFYDLARLFDRHGLRIECNSPLGDGEVMLRLTPAEKLVPLTGASIVVVAGNDSFGERLGLQMLATVLPGEADVHYVSFETIKRASARYDLAIIGAGTGLLQPLHSDAVIDLVSRSRGAIGIFGTQRRELIVRPALERLLGRLDTWYARDEDDLLLYGRGCRNAVHLGDWTIRQCPITSASETEPLTIGAAALRDMALDRAIERIRRHASVLSTDRAALLCALTAADTAAYREEPDQRLSGVAGEFRGLLLDVFGRSYPEGEHFLIDRDAVRRYRSRVLANVAGLRERIAALLAQPHAAAAAA